MRARCSPRPVAIDCCARRMSHSQFEVGAVEEPAVASFSRFGRVAALAEGKSIDDYAILFIGLRMLQWHGSHVHAGAEGPTLTSFMMTLNRCPFYTFDPATGVGRQETLGVSKTLKRRCVAQRAPSPVTTRPQILSRPKSQGQQHHWHCVWHAGRGAVPEGDRGAGAADCAGGQEVVHILRGQAQSREAGQLF